MRTREYGQYCGLARAAEVLGQRWTLLVLRDLGAGPRRYSDLVAGLPGIPTNVLATRLKELEADGLVARETVTGERGVRYRLTARGEALTPALDELGRWGAATMRVPREGEVFTGPALLGALRVAAGGGRAPGRRRVVYQVLAGDGVAAHAVVRGGEVEVAPGEHPEPDLVVLAGPGLRDVLAGVVDADTALARGMVELDGDTSLFPDFLATFHVPYDASVDVG